MLKQNSMFLKTLNLKSKEDYSKYETTIIDAAKWLEETDLNGHYC